MDLRLVERIRGMSEEEFMRWKPEGELREGADPDATVATGMCGSPKKCYVCPSTFLCAMKAGDEMRLIKARGGG
jgi:hypothetical protein